MRYPPLRILLALLIGVWSPLCCCQAKALAGIACSPSLAAEAATDSCCHECNDESVPSDDDWPDEHGGSPPGDCHSCPSCRGISVGAGLQTESKLSMDEQGWNALATLALPVLHGHPRPDDAIVASRPSWWESPPHVRANRDVQRWHCALIL